MDDFGRYDKAVYRVGDEEYFCMFPAESVGRKKIYKTDKAYDLLISRFGSHKTALDRHSLFIIAIGTVISVVFVVLLIAGTSLFRNILVS